MVSKTGRNGTQHDKAQDEGQAADNPKTGTDAETTAPASSPLTTLILTDIAMSAGSALLARSVGGRGMAGRVLARALPTRSPGGLIRGPSLAGSLVGTAIARIATRSVPGAIVVGGGLVAKALYERRKAKRAAKAATVTPRKPR
jgi:hypothetical protein